MSGGAVSDIVDLPDDAARLHAVRDFHRTWGDRETDSVDVLALWEQLGRLLGVDL